MGSQGNNSKTRRRRVAGIIALAAGSLVVGTGVAAIALPVPLTHAVGQEVLAGSGESVPLEWPTWGSGALGAIGRKEPLSVHGPQTPVPIASITKIVTALVVLDRHPLAVGEAGPTISYTDADVAIYNEQIAKEGSVAAVQAGVELSLRQTLEAVLIPSANNYAISLANWAFGGHEGFVDATRAWLERQSLGDTVVIEASGLDPASTSTPTQLVRIAELALQNPVIAEIVATQSVELPGAGFVTNTNELLGRDGVNGVKTGSTDEAGFCLLFSSQIPVGSHVVTVVGAMLGSAETNDLNNAVNAVLASSREAFHEVQVTAAGESYAQYTTPWGETAELVSDTDSFVVTWQDEPVRGMVRADAIESAQQGQALGVLDFSDPLGIAPQVVNLTVNRAVSGPALLWRWAHFFGLA